MAAMGEAISHIARAKPIESFECQDGDFELESVFMVCAENRGPTWRIHHYLCYYAAGLLCFVPAGAFSRCVVSFQLIKPGGHKPVDCCNGKICIQ